MKGLSILIQRFFVLFFVFHLWAIPIGLAQFENIVTEHPASDNELLNELTCIIETKSGEILVGTKYHGLFENSSLSFNPFSKDSKVRNILKYVELNCIFEDLDGSIWLGTSEGYLHLQVDGNFTSFHQINENRSHPWNNIQDIFIDEKRMLWAATYEGLAKVNLQNQKTDLFQPQDIANTPFPTYEKRINCLLQDPIIPERLWIGSRYGLKSFNKKNGTFTYYDSPAKWHDISPEIQKYSIVQIKMDSSGTLYMASRSSGGIITYKPNANKWTQFLFKGGLKTDPYTINGVNSINIAGDSIVYFGCDEGAGYLDFANHELIPFDTEIKENSSLLSGSLIDKDNQLWFVGRFGLSKINLNEIVFPPIQQLPIIKSISTNDDALTFDKFIRLDKDIDELEIQLSMTKPYLVDDYSFSWKLDPIDKDWVSNTNQGKVNYDKLKGGNYVFKYRYENSTGSWLEGNPLEIKIKREWHESTGLICLIIAGFLLIVGIIAYYIIRQIKKNSEQKLAYEKRLADAELTALRSQMNPHFIFNSLNSIYNFIHNNEMENAAEYLAKFSKLMRIVLNNSKEKLVSLEDELLLLNLYLELEQIRFAHKFEYDIELSNDIDPVTIFIPPMLLQPYIENAIWHGLMHKEGKGLLNLHISKDQDQIFFTISDNGIGRDRSRIINASKKRKSVGMEINKNRIESFELIYGKAGKVEIIDLRNEKGEATGTRVVISIPMMTKDAT